jgi:hypothetical protein|tara:strand:+ start:2318 stop:3112 length:795 start_codon:yes stop_codon:yes gene_type:complete
MSDFESLYAEGEATDYAANAEPVPQEEVNAIHENLTQAMGDSVLNGQTENLGAEMVGEPLPPEPMGITGQDGPEIQPTNQVMDNTPDPLEQFMEAHSEDFRDVSGMKLADYEEWLFKSEEGAGEIAVARIVSNFRASGYDVKPTYAAVAGATWSRMNYGGEEHMDALKKVERASVADLHPLVVEVESEGLTSLVETVRKAESQAEDFRAEMITQIKSELRADEEQKAADSVLESENTTMDWKMYVAPTLLGLVTIGGMALTLRK